jgi:hypothetical protein
MKTMKYIIQLRIRDKTAIKQIFGLKKESGLKIGSNKQKAHAVDLIVKSLKHVSVPSPRSLIKLVWKISQAVSVFTPRSGFSFGSGSNSIDQQYLFL